MRHRMTWELAQDGKAVAVLTAMGAELHYNVQHSLWTAEFFVAPGNTDNKTDAELEEMTEEEFDDYFDYDEYEAPTLYELMLQVKEGRRADGV